MGFIVDRPKTGTVKRRTFMAVAVSVMLTSSPVTAIPETSEVKPGGPDQTSLWAPDNDRTGDRAKEGSLFDTKGTVLVQISTPDWRSETWAAGLLSTNFESGAATRVWQRINELARMLLANQGPVGNTFRRAALPGSGARAGNFARGGTQTRYRESPLASIISPSERPAARSKKNVNPENGAAADFIAEIIEPTLAPGGLIAAGVETFGGFAMVFLSASETVDVIDSVSRERFRVSSVSWGNSGGYTGGGALTERLGMENVGRSRGSSSSAIAFIRKIRGYIVFLFTDPISIALIILAFTALFFRRMMRRPA